MGASESLFDGVSGLTGHQTWMNVIGNNIANVNTVGFKDENFSFADEFSQTIKGATSSVIGGPGGTDAIQIGLGTETGSIVGNQQQGSLQTTNVTTDFAIEGDGFFIVSDGNAQHYTRDGHYIVDGFGNINQASTGFHLQGFGLKQTGNTVAVDTSKIVNLTVPQQINPAQQTNVLDLFGNLQSNTTTAQTQSIGVYDSLGQLHNVVLTFTPPTTAGGDWAVSATSADLAPGARIDVRGGNDPASSLNTFPTSGTTGGVAALHFNALGQLDGTVTPLNLVFDDGTGTSGLLPPAPWLIPGTTTTTNAIQAAVQLNLIDPAVGATTSFASPTSLQTQAVANAVPLVGTQNNSTVSVTGNFQYLASTSSTASQTTLTFNAADNNGFTHTFAITERETATTGAPTSSSTWQITSVTIDGFNVATSSTASNSAITVAGSSFYSGPSTNSVLSTTAGSNGIFTITIPSGFFSTSSNFQTGPGGTPGVTNFNVIDVNTPLIITVDESKVTDTTLASGLTPAASGTAGNSAGTLKDFNVDQTGFLHGVYTNGFTQLIGQIVLARFENPGGLARLGMSDLDVSANSGVVNIGTPGSGRFGTIAEGNVETSNVDLAAEFSNMILAERGFQANSRIITTSDQMLQEVVDLKR